MPLKKKKRTPHNGLDKQLIQEERNRYSKEIHDSVSQNLTAISFNLQLCLNLIEKNPAKVKDFINSTLKVIENCASELKYIVYSPAALGKSGFITFIKEFTDEYKGNLTILLSDSNDKTELFSLNQELFLWRFFNELVTNISEQKSLKILIKPSEDIVLKFEFEEKLKAKEKKDNSFPPDLDRLTNSAADFGFYIEEIENSFIFKFLG